MQLKFKLVLVKPKCTENRFYLLRCSSSYCRHFGYKSHGEGKTCICSLYGWAVWPDCHITVSLDISMIQYDIRTPPPPSVSAQQTPHPSLKVVGVRSWVWSWVTICIKSLTTDTVWTCAASVSDQERTAGFCTWTCWWAVTLQHFIKMTRHVRIYTLNS